VARAIGDNMWLIEHAATDEQAAKAAQAARILAVLRAATPSLWGPDTPEETS
jgi:hypothetical protein